MEVLNDTAKLSDRHYSRMDQQEVDFKRHHLQGPTSTRGRVGFVRTDHTPKKRSPALPPTGQDRLLQEWQTASGREACKPRRGQQKKRNSLRDTNDDPRYRRRDQERDRNKR